MKKRESLIMATAGALALGVGLAYVLSTPDRVSARSGSWLRDGTAHFVVTEIAFAVGPDASEAGTCPDGMSLNVAEIYGQTAEGKRRPGESDEQYGKRVEDGGQAISATSNGKNFCMHPELAPRDPHTRILASASARAEGIDIDGKISRSKRDAQTGRLDFVGLDGTKGVDNQFWRAVGCSRSYQSDGPSNGFDTEMYTGSWGILVTIEDLDDLQNDDHVEVGFYANADPIQLSPTREALEYATYAMDQDPRFRATTTGRIVNGKLETKPVDVRFHSVVNGMHLERPLRDARFVGTLSARGKLEGYLAGYTPVKEMYDVQFAYRNGKNADGTPSDIRRRIGSANGAARVLGHTCHGVWQSLNRLADGHRDPRTGKYTSISTQYRLEARPAFAVDVNTAGKNDKLARND